MYKLICALAVFSYCVFAHSTSVVDDEYVSIESEYLHSIPAQDKLIIKQNVRVKFRDYLLKSQEAIIVFAKFNNVEKISVIEVPNSFVLINLSNPHEIITADSAVYSRDEMTLRLKGNVKIKRDGQFANVENFTLKINPKNIGH